MSPVDQDRLQWVISGGIGSGKSAVRRLLEEAGFFTVDADSVGHEVLRAGEPAFRSVAERWPDVVDEDTIDRAALGQIVFADQVELAELEKITHPHIFGRIRDRIQGIPDPVAVEIPLLEHRLGSDWDRLIVDSANEVRLQRLVDRGMSEDDARARMASQPGRQEWLARADIVLPNHGSLEALGGAVEVLLSSK